jgi:hypothetical protein
MSVTVTLDYEDLLEAIKHYVELKAGELKLEKGLSISEICLRDGDGEEVDLEAVTVELD